MIGVKCRAEIADPPVLRNKRVVGERSYRTEAKGVTHGGALRSENAGTSNHNAGEIPARRKTKVSSAMVIN